MINKIVHSMAEAMAGVRDGAVILVGGFGSIGQPNALIEALIEQGAKDLTVVANNAGVGHVGLARLMEVGRVRKIVCSYPRTSDPVVFEGLYRKGLIELEVMPQGTMAEKWERSGSTLMATPWNDTQRRNDGAGGKRRQAEGQPEPPIVKSAGCHRH